MEIEYRYCEGLKLRRGAAWEVDYAAVGEVEYPGGGGDVEGLFAREFIEGMECQRVAWWGCVQGRFGWERCEGRGGGEHDPAVWSLAW